MSSRLLSTPLAPVDRAWLRMDEPSSLMIINGVMAFDRDVPTDRVRTLISERLLAIPRFSERITLTPAGHMWEPTEVRIEDHVVEHQLSEPGDDAALEAYVSARMSERLDRSRPLWTCDVIHGFGQGSALLWRIHHCMGDGIALMLVMLALTDRHPDIDSWAATRAGDTANGNPLSALFTDRSLTHEEAKEHLAGLMPEALTLLTRPAEILGRLPRWQLGLAASASLAKLTALPPDPRTPFKGALGVEKRVAWSDPVRVADITALRSVTGGTVNDILTTAVAGGLRRYLIGSGHHSNVNVRAVVPVSLRPLESMAALGNDFGLVFLSLPLGIEDPRVRLEELQRRMRKLKSSAESIVALWFLRQIGKVPQGAQNLVLRLFGAKGTAVMTNVPGPREQLSFAGAKIRQIMFWVPQSGRLGMGISVLSYGGDVRVGVVTDAGLVPDPQRIVDGFSAELDLLATLGR